MHFKIYSHVIHIIIVGMIKKICEENKVKNKQKTIAENI